jgi:hypothetical protein
MPKKQKEATLSLRLWDVKRHTDKEWYVAEFERIGSMVAQGYTSGEIIGERGETGWWGLKVED